jgi:hypothetical protein
VRAILGLTGALVAIESVALAIGLCLLQRAAGWCTASNALLALSDIAGGAWLVAAAVRGDMPGRTSILAVTVALFATHVFRGWQYLAGAANPFCANPPLFVFNNIRLAGLLVLGVVAAIGLVSS